MTDEQNSGDNITVGDIKNVQGIAIGRNASARVTGGIISEDVTNHARNFGAL